MKRFSPSHSPFAACAAALLLAASHSIAQIADPTDPAAPVPPATYRNALQGFHTVAEAPVGDWKTANAQVSKAGKSASAAAAADTHAGHQHGAPEAPREAQSTHAGQEAHDPANCMDHMKHMGMRKDMHKDMMSMGKGKHNCPHQEHDGKAGPMHCQHDMKHGGDHE